jgi:hypothetical protein
MPPEFRSAAIYHVLYADTVGYTKHSLDEKAFVDRTLLDAVAARQKQECPVLTVDTGDGFFMAFAGDPRAACRAAISLRDELAQRFSARVRIGVHSGVAMLRDDLKSGVNMTGPAVELAQRVMSLSTGEEILVSDQLAAHLQEFDEWRDRLKRPRPLPTKYDQTLVVWELDQADSEPSVLIISEPGTDVDVATVLSPFCRVISIASPDDVVGLADVARCAKAYPLVVAVAHRQSIFQRALFQEDRPTAEDHGVGVGWISTASNAREWLPTADTAQLKAALQTQIEAMLSSVELKPREQDDLYLERGAHRPLRDALDRGVGIILVRAPRFAGKTSLLFRGLAHARHQGWKAVVTDFQSLDRSVLASGESLYRAIGHSFISQHGSSKAAPEWKPELGPNTNLESIIQDSLEASPGQTLWIWDSVEKLFDGTHQDDLFGLLRSWHNRRAWDENGPWSRITIALAYSTDAERLIKNPKQSPFNVGARIELSDFDLAEFKRLHELAGAPIMRTQELESAHALTGGDAYLSRLLLEGVVKGQLRVADLLENRWPENSDWGRHMAALCEAAVCDPESLAALRTICRKGRPNNPLAVLRLIHLGVLRPSLVQRPMFRSLAYSQMFTRLLGS